MEESRLSKWQLASYGAPAMPLAMNGLILATYLPAVYADAEGFGTDQLPPGRHRLCARHRDEVSDLPELRRTPVATERELSLIHI